MEDYKSIAEKRIASILPILPSDSPQYHKLLDLSVNKSEVNISSLDEQLNFLNSAYTANNIPIDQLADGLLKLKSYTSIIAPGFESFTDIITNVLSFQSKLERNLNHTTSKFKKFRKLELQSNKPLYNEFKQTESEYYNLLRDYHIYPSEDLGRKNEMLRFQKHQELDLKRFDLDQKLKYTADQIQLELLKYLNETTNSYYEFFSSGLEYFSNCIERLQLSEVVVEMEKNLDLSRDKQRDARVKVMKDMILKQRVFQASLVGHGLASGFGPAGSNIMSTVDYGLRNKPGSEINDIIIKQVISPVAKISSPASSDFLDFDPNLQAAKDIALQYLSSPKEGYVYRPHPRYQRVFLHLENGVLTLVDPKSDKVDVLELFNPNKIISIRDRADSTSSSIRSMGRSVDFSNLTPRTVESLRSNSIPNISMYESLNSTDFVSDHISLLLYSVTEVKDCVHGFEITNGHHTLTLQAASEPDMKEWVNALQTEILLLKKFQVKPEEQTESENKIKEEQ